MRYHAFSRTTPFPVTFALALALALTGCDRANEAFEQAIGAGADDQPGSLFRYNREYVFLAPSNDGPLVVPFDFSARERGDQIERGARAWLARGTVWDRFLDESSTTTAAGGVWRVVPISEIRLNVGGAAQIETIHFERGERQLRLELDSPLSDWQQGDETRFRLLRGRVIIGTEVVTGPVLELLRYERTLADGWPPGQDFDAVFLSTGDTIQMLIAETLSGDGEGDGYAWIRTPASERTWEDGELRWLDVRAFQDARRDIPVRWSFRVPGANVTGELEADGFDAILGPERGGRRAIEIRYTVSGTIEIGGERREVVGAIRHTQQ
jgi:hypothetical protein